MVYGPKTLEKHWSTQIQKYILLRHSVSIQY